jgi:hypothetical protein
VPCDLAYYDKATITAVKSFIVQAPEMNKNKIKNDISIIANASFLQHFSKCFGIL